MYTQPLRKADTYLSLATSTPTKETQPLQESCLTCAPEEAPHHPTSLYHPEGGTIEDLYPD